MITDGPEPKHAQLRAILEQRCATELKPGDPLPGERALEEEYGVSRITVRRAIGDLVQAGRLRRVRGKGTFVAPAPLVSSTHVASLSDAMRDSDVRATARVLAAELAAPPAEISEFFRTPAGTRHAHLRRLRLGDGQPYGIDDAWYNAALVPRLLDHDLTASVYGLLQREYALEIAEVEQSVTALAASPADAALLGVAPAAPVMKVVRCSLGESGGELAPAEYCASLYRTDRYRLRTRVVREAG